VILVRHAHVDQAVQRNAMQRQAVIYRSLFVFRLVGEVGGHRIRGIRRSCCNGGRLCGLRFKLALPSFKICDAFCQRPILFAQLFGLCLDVRNLIGMRRRCDGKNRRCRQNNPVHERSPTIARRNIRDSTKITEPLNEDS
jgi:hypothetical protein